MEKWNFLGFYIICSEKHAVFTARLLESFITWCKDKHQKLHISKTNELVLDYNASNMMLQKKKYKF